jgi:hypothetical protein
MGVRGGGARVGFCPTVYHGAAITTIPVPGGVRVQLRADTAGGVKRLQEVVAARAARLPGFTSS